MNDGIILITILLLVVAVNLIVVNRIRKRTDKIVGVDSDKTGEEVEEGKAWRALLCRWISTGNVITLIGGGVSIYFDNLLLYTLFVSLPVPLGLLFAYGKKCKSGKGGSQQKSTVLIVTIAVVFLLELVAIVAVSFHGSGDIDLSFNPKELEIHGLYGTNIPYEDIKQLSLKSSLPAIKHRSSGFEARKTRLGNFVTNDDLRIMLFTHSDTCFIRIVTKSNEVYYLSSRQPNKTKTLLGEIQKRI
ncbi:hypothetical protein HMPREF2955_02490 [Prevotella sp. HMSC073D09]|jgi:hypothetical protein|uniref:hypothetical protein n=1 Tax=Prevotella TaxID=838 RepID=UPI000310F27D|nr:MULTISPECIES: hypothetical protein [Prevotella]OFQ09257.1 hypothetical protein HMPREF2955_02490 [Prevotella sp. HMSC073D09]